MKNKIKGFGQFVNEGWFSKDKEAEQEKTNELTDINTLGVFKFSDPGADHAGVMTRIDSTMNQEFVRSPEEDTDDWTQDQWNEYICRYCNRNGLKGVYIPEQNLVIKCG
jgi:hypothetical protein